MSQIGPYLSQMGPKNLPGIPPDWRRPYPPNTTVQLKGTLMSRTRIYALTLALLASAALSTGCTRTDSTGPSEQPEPSFEMQGANN
jgi:hypothetical protein